MQGIYNPLFGLPRIEPRRVINTFMISITLRVQNVGFEAVWPWTLIQRSYQQSEAIIDKRTPKTISVQNMNNLQQNMLEILLYNPYNWLQIILKNKAQMSYWQLFYKIWSISVKNMPL